MDNMGTCRDCGKTIRWLLTTNNKPMPVNAETTMPDDTIFDNKRHVPHWADCPNGATFRKKAPKQTHQEELL